MNIRKGFMPLAIGLVTVSLSLYPGALALAESEDAGVNVGANIQTNVGDNGSSHEDASVGATTSADMHGSDNKEMNIESSDRGSATSSMHREDSRQSSNEQQNQGNEGNSNNAGDNSGSDNGIEIDHEAAMQASTTIESSDEVHNQGELRSFLNHIVKADDHISNVSVSSTTVDTQYSLPANFLGAIPAHIQAQVSVGTDGTVTISYPWYAFFFAKNDSELKSQLTQAAASTSASTAFSASLEAHLLDSIFSILRGN